MTDPTVPELTPVVSSNVKAVGHDGDALFVEFKDKADGTPGSLYKYPGLDATHFDAMTADGASAGGHFAKFVRHVKDFVKLR